MTSDHIRTVWLALRERGKVWLAAKRLASRPTCLVRVEIGPWWLNDKHWMGSQSAKRRCFQLPAPCQSAWTRSASAR